MAEAPPDQAPPPPAADRTAGVLLRGLGGAILGAVVGTAATWLAMRFLGIFMLALPAAFLGLGCAWLSRRRSWPLAILCALAGGALSVVLEWAWLPFKADPSFSYFLSHLAELSTRFRVQVLLSVLFAGYFGLGRDPAWWSRDPAYQAAQRHDPA